MPTSKERAEANARRGALLLPDHMRGGYLRYVMDGIKPGDFMLRMLEGKLEEARLFADRANMRAWATWECVLNDFTPTECHSTPGRVATWIAVKGLNGLGESEGK